MKPEYSLEGLMLKLKLQYFDSDAGKYKRNIEGKRRRGWQGMRRLHGIIDTMDMSLSKVQEMVSDREAYHDAVHGVTKSRTWLRDWTIIHTDIYYYISYTSVSSI